MCKVDLFQNLQSGITHTRWQGFLPSGNLGCKECHPQPLAVIGQPTVAMEVKSGGPLHPNANSLTP